MKIFLNFTNGALIYFVAGYSLLDSWQAWVLMLFYIVSIEAIELKNQNDIRKKITPHLDNLESALKKFYPNG